MSSSGLMYRTPADVRAIPNQQWEAWICDKAKAGPLFSAEASCQMVVRWCAKAAQGRMSR